MLTIEASKIKNIMVKLNGLSYQKILFNGPWGIGKTKYILDSIKNEKDIYYISLFGKNNINTFYEELYYLLLSNNKVRIKKVLKHMNRINFSRFGLSISIPLMSDIMTNIQKELKGKSDITIIIDDLERKSDDLEIKEIFGFIDSITKNNGIKIILVASFKNFSSIEKEVFEDYAEKSIDRIYKITDYSKVAPQKIMGEDIWASIKNLYIENKSKNLRTLEKTNFFIEEVIKEISVDFFNEKFNKEDVYKICAAVVIFVVDHNKETMLLPVPEKSDDISSVYYNIYKSKENYPNYIWHYILKNNLKNSMMQVFIPFILEWFETGDFSREQLKNLCKQVDSYKESSAPIFMSDNQIKEEIAELSNIINNFGENISIENLMQRLDELASIAEKTDLEFTYNVDQVVEWILDNSDSQNNINNTYFDLLPRRESAFINEVIADLKVKSVKGYSNQLISKMLNNLKRRNFTDNDIHLVKEFKIFYDNLVGQNKNDEKNKLINQMKDNNWFLPLPYGEITYPHWTYCHNIFQCLEHISSREDKLIKEGALKYFNQEIDKSSDEIFKYRMRSLISQYLK